MRHAHLDAFFSRLYKARKAVRQDDATMVEKPARAANTRVRHHAGDDPTSLFASAGRDGQPAYR